MKRDGRRQLKEAHQVGNVHQNWITANAHVQQLILLPISGSFPGALPSPCLVPAWTTGGHFYPVCSHVSLLFSILFKPFLIHRNIILLQVVFPVTGKMNEESWHLSTPWHRATGDKCCHTSLCFGSFSIQSPTWLSYLSVFFSSLLSFLFPPPPKGSKLKGRLILLITFTDILHRKEINTFLMSCSDNKSCASPRQSWVWKVQGAVAPCLLLLQLALLGYRAWGWLYPNQNKCVSHRVLSRQPACSTSPMSLYSPRGNLHLFGLFFSIVCLLGYILMPLKNQLQSSFSETFLFVRLRPSLSALV